MTAGVPEEHIEAAARAIKREANVYLSWDQYRRMAAAALAALNLTEEWSVERGQGVFAFMSGSYPDYDSAAAAAKRIDKRYWNSMSSVPGAGMAAPNAHPVRRLVSGWVRVEEQPQ